MIVTAAEERVRRVIPYAAGIAGVAVDARQAVILTRAAARAASASPQGQPVACSLPSGPEIRPQDVAVLRILASGGGPADVAAELGISYEGARSRLSRLLVRLGVGARIEAVAWAYEWGVLGGEQR